MTKREIEEHARKCVNNTEYLMNLANNGIEFSDFMKITYLKAKFTFLPELIDHALHGEWEEFCKRAICCYEVMPEAFDYYEEVPDHLKRDFVVSCYLNHGDSVPGCRKALRGLLKYSRPELPPEIVEREEITVYRAGEEPIQKAKYRISWTTSPDVANFFFNEYTGKHANFVYRGKIKTKDIIAYSDKRNEKEVMQYGKVFDIEDVTSEF